MVADLAPARRLEGQLTRRRRCRVAGDAGESAMGFMGEGVGGRRWVGRLAGREDRPAAARLPCPLDRPGSTSRNALLQRLGGIERERWPQLALRPCAPTRGTRCSRSRPPGPRGAAWQVSQRCGPLPVRRTDMERDAPPVGVTLRIGAGLECVRGLRVRVRVVAHPAAAPVRVLGRIEGRQDLAHLVAAEALALRRGEDARRGVEGHELRLGRELVAGVAVELLLVGERVQIRRLETRRHPAEPDLDLVGEVAALLRAGRVGRAGTGAPIGRGR